MRRQLAVVALAVVSLVVISFLLPVAILVRNQAENRALSAAERDAEAVAAALAVASATETGSILNPDIAEALIVAFGSRPGLSVVFPTGTVVGAPVDETLALERVGVAAPVRIESGIEVLVPVFTADGPAVEEPVVVRAFVPEEELRKGVAVAWWMLGGLGVFLIVVAVVAADRLAQTVVRPVLDLSAAARRLGDGDLTTRVLPGGPVEVAEVGSAFNRLAERLGSLLSAERESVADLSHRLRTPLTALRLQAGTVSNPVEAAALSHDIEKVEEAVDRLIREARRPSESSGAASSDLGSITRHRAAFWKIVADEQRRPTSVSVSEGPLTVGLPGDELGAVVDTLLENVFAHTPEGTAYRVVATRRDGFVSLVIEDEGPGFPAMTVTQRGYSGRGSTGLGLDIVSRAAEKCGGGLEVGTSPAGGARVVATFQVVDSAS